MRILPSLLVLVPAALGAGLLVDRAPAGVAPPPFANGEVQILPFGLMNEVRRTEGRVPMKVQVYNPGTGSVLLESLRVREAGGALLDEIALHGERLAGDAGRVGDLYLKMELIDPELSHRHDARIFIPLDQRPELARETETRLFMEIIEGVQELKQSGAPQLRNVGFELDLGRLLAGARPGDEAALDVELSYRLADGSRALASLTHSIAVLAEHLAPPAEWWSAGGMGRAAGAWHAGDMHVHNCRDEAVGGCPSCAAESVNISGSFTNADLKPQFLALGLDFFSTTTHSYCINGDFEFAAVKQEADTLDDAGFVLICGTEVTGEETGGQSGSDAADALCYLGFGAPVHHMGAHAITSRKAGGSDGFLDFCDDPKKSQWKNVPAINGEGGFAIANHPGASMWSYNSTLGFRGFNHGYTFGTEVWNGDSLAPNGPSVWWWRQRMLDGELTYPMSGSDTHDTAYDFGALHVWVEGGYDEAGLVAAIKGGRAYLSNGPFLDFELRDHNGRSALGGAVVSVNSAMVPVDYPLDAVVYYNVAQAATVRVWRGVVGGADEVLVEELPVAAGGGSVVVATDLDPGATTWYRAEVEQGGTNGSAWSMPVYVILR